MITATLLVVVPLPVFNVVNDYYGVFGVIGGSNVEYFRLNEFQVTANERFKDLYWLSHNDHPFDSFLLGSSRGEAIPIEALGDNWLNLSLPDGRPIDYARAVQVLSRHMGVKEVVVALDHFGFYGKVDRQLPATRLYPESWYDWPEFLAAYLFRISSPYFIRDRSDPRLYRRIRIVPGLASRELIELRARQRKNRIDVLAARKAPQVVDLSDQIEGFDKPFEAIEEIVRLGKERGFEIKFLFNPYHYKNLLSMDMDAVGVYKRRLATLTNFYDFSGLNEFTGDNGFWRDLSHFDSEVGARMVDVLASGPSDSFGRITTLESVDEDHRQMLAGISAGLPELLRKDQNIWIHPSLLSPIEESITVESRGQLSETQVRPTGLGFATVAPSSAVSLSAISIAVPVAVLSGTVAAGPGASLRLICRTDSMTATKGVIQFKSLSAEPSYFFAPISNGCARDGVTLGLSPSDVPFVFEGIRIDEIRYLERSSR